MLNHEFWVCLNKIYLISPYGSETFFNDPPSLAVTFLQKRPPPLILCWWRLISPRAPESNVFPPKKNNLSSLDDPKRKESNLFLPVFPRANIFSRDMSTLKLRVCRLFYFPSSFSIYQFVVLHRGWISVVTQFSQEKMGQLSVGVNVANWNGKNIND